MFKLRRCFMYDQHWLRSPVIFLTACRSLSGGDSEARRGVSALRTLRQSVRLKQRAPSVELELSVTRSGGTLWVHCDITLLNSTQLSPWPPKPTGQSGLNLSFSLKYKVSPQLGIALLLRIINQFYNAENDDMFFLAKSRDKKFTGAGQETLLSANPLLSTFVQFRELTPIVAAWKWIRNVRTLAKILQRSCKANQVHFQLMISCSVVVTLTWDWWQALCSPLTDM